MHNGRPLPLAALGFKFLVQGIICESLVSICCVLSPVELDLFWMVSGSRQLRPFDITARRPGVGKVSSGPCRPRGPSQQQAAVNKSVGRELTLEICPMLGRGSRFSLLGVGYLLAALRSLLTINKEEGVPIMLELLTAKACPAAVLLLLQLAAAGRRLPTTFGLAASGNTKRCRDSSARARSSCGTEPRPGSRTQQNARHPMEQLSLSCVQYNHPASSAGWSLPRSTRGAEQSVRPRRVIKLLKAQWRLHSAEPAARVSAGHRWHALLLGDIYFLAFKQLSSRGFIVDEAWYGPTCTARPTRRCSRSCSPSRREATANFGVEKDRLFCACTVSIVQSTALPW